jgi:RHS repeat-associated protein
LSFALGATSITSDAVTRDARTAMIVDQSVDGVDANLLGANFGYDRSGRLVNWWQRDPGSGNKYQGSYNFTGYSGTAPVCANAQWGRNSNRLSFEQKTYNTAGTLTATAVEAYCYDNADRLSTHVPVSGTSPFNGVSYDSHGNVIKMRNEVHGYDSADRHIISKLPGGAVEYVRDATDRIVTRKLSGVISAKYAYTASADSPSLTLNSSGAVIERTISLPGGVLVTTRGTTASDVWSYPNIHGDIIATTNGAGTKAGATRGYDPFGNLLGTSTTPDNSAGPFDYGWHGSAQRPVEYSSGFTPLIEMGARQYSSLLGRFLETDPILGGNANDYAYPLDPLNQSDLDGNWGWSWKDIRRVGRHSGRRANQAVRFGRNWSNGSTQIGLVYGIASGASCRGNRQELMIKCSSARRFSRAGGMTVGNVLVGTKSSREYGRRLMAHEAKHSDQWSALGWSFPALYGIAYGRSSGCNVFDRAAGYKDGGYLECR